MELQKQFVSDDDGLVTMTNVTMMGMQQHDDLRTPAKRVSGSSVYLMRD